MLKTKIKFLIIALGFLFALIFFNTNTVNATTEEEAQKALDLLPDEIYLDIPEIEYKKSNKLIEEKILKIWSDNGINKDNMTFNIWGYQPFDMERFYESSISIYTKTYINKKIKITYNNTKNKDSATENAIKNIKLEEKKYFDVDIAEITKANIVDVSKEYYTNLINNNSIEVFTEVPSGGESPLSMYAEHVYIMLFKDKQLYDIRYMGEGNSIGIIKVPSNISDKELDKYCVDLINKYLEQSPKKDYFKERAVSITKGTDKENIPNGYTVNYDNGLYDYVKIIRQEETSLQLKDKTTNIKIDTTTIVLPANTQLVVKELKEGETYKAVEKLLTNDVNKMFVYDITLQSEGVKVQPNGKVKVSIPIPEGLDTNNLIVYRVDEKGNKTEYKVKVETIDNIKYATFETNHFSTYVLGEKAEETTTNTEATAKGEKDETPKTGSKNTVINVLGTIAIITIATVVTKKLIK